MEEIPLIYVVDDDAELCRSLVYLFDSVGWRSRVFHDAEAFLAHLAPGETACLLLDVRMPGMSGLEVQDRLARTGRMLPIVFFSGHGDIAMAVQAVRNGAVDFIEKPFREQTLLEAVGLALRRLPAERYLNEVRRRFMSLTPREREVAKLVVLGRRNKIIAGELSISERTVQVHRQNVMDKMRAGSAAELVQDLMRLGEV
ncbi:response regulator transcription factor [Paludibacterium paludis]|uniref:DNA-binding response regulator n=1 Tax=Paludibacterium paludis TaxID=1225769 RepID=A0A918UBA3_9NEIS|nr:response regulator [Paludibacterium paludis]GGY21706.1 DNA-binding response regulator [Paludibacterium paludis]